MNVRPITTLHPNGQRVRDALDRLGVTSAIVETVDPSPTAAAAAAQLDIVVGQVANSLIFDADGEPILVMTSGAHRVHTDRLATFLGAREVRRPNAAFVRTHTGQPIGGVAPVGHPAAIRTVVDTSLGDWPIVWAAGGHPHYVFATSFDELLRITNGVAFSVGDD